MNKLILSSLRLQRNKKSLTNIISIQQFSRFQRFKAKQTQQAASPSSTMNPSEQLFNKDSAMTEVQQNIGLRTFLNKCYMTTGLAIGGFLSTSQLAIATGLAFNPATQIFALGALVPLIGFSFTQPTYQQDSNGHIQCISSPLRQGLFWGSIGMMGLGVSPMFLALTVGQPALLPTSVLLTTGVCAGASLYAYSRPSASMLYLRGPLMGCLFSMIGLQLVGGLLAYTGVTTSIMAISHNISLYGGLFIFTGFMAYDTHQAIESYKIGEPDHLNVAMQLFLNFKNLLIRIMIIMRGGSDE